MPSTEATKMFVSVFGVSYSVTRLGNFLLFVTGSECLNGSNANPAMAN